MIKPNFLPLPSEATPSLSTTYELVLLQIVNQHLTSFLVAHIFSNLIENENAHEDEEARAEWGARVRRLRQTFWQILVEVHRLYESDKNAVSVLHLEQMTKLAVCLYLLILQCNNNYGISW